MNDIVHEIKMIDTLLLRHIISDAPTYAKVSPIQFSIIMFLLKNHNKDIYQKDIEKNIGLRRSTISGILKTMEKNGLIEKNDSSLDGRSKKIIITDKVLQKKSECERKRNELEQILCKDISSQDFEIFLKVTKQIENNLKKEGTKC